MNNQEIIEYMKAKGFSVNGDPRHHLRFKKASYHVWQISSGWQTANLVGKQYQGHKPMPTIFDAANRWDNNNAS